MKNNLPKAIAFLLLAVLAQACSSTLTNDQENEQPVEKKEAVPMEPVRVEVRQENGGFQLYRGGEPYYIKGAGGTRFLDRLAAYGGNSIRTWSTDNAQEILDEAYRNGLTVTLGLDVGRERHGFDYDDPAAVEQQLTELQKEVEKYRNHPALLLWGIGNELNLNYTNPLVWDAVNDIAKMIHEVDPNHPTSTMLAGINQLEVDYIKENVPELDILAINAYGGLPDVPARVRSFGWEGPYIITEWGPTGHWESQHTSWAAAVEETSGEKAAVYKSRYESTMGRDTTHNLGSYVFLWGQKQERTPTWYGLFTEDGKETEVVDVMQYLWTGSWPENRAPHLKSLKLDGKQAEDNIFLKPDKSYNVNVDVSDPDKDELTYRYELLHESTDLKEGGDREDRPDTVPDRLTETDGDNANLQAPVQEGAYRLFVYVYDGHDNVATANIPFYVKK
ncbi:glycoside hydrolase family 2 TIM barrel-domain containing protein [Pontibacter russatus]|uniref:glycoside hydrolase family 2 TIM barrel-domain containing protein n=1 Tax=Pontibacter russatus TaxID=2694929 RepID=UPI001379FB3B|nr:glycoside hydrolase family 2 TIM barrel-domain containing protein [Pontibacter russatus]